MYKLLYLHDPLAIQMKFCMATHYIILYTMHILAYISLGTEHFTIVIVIVIVTTSSSTSITTIIIIRAAIRLKILIVINRAIKIYNRD